MLAPASLVEHWERKGTAVVLQQLLLQDAGSAVLHQQAGWEAMVMEGPWASRVTAHVCTFESTAAVSGISKPSAVMLASNWPIDIFKKQVSSRCSGNTT